MVTENGNQPLSRHSNSTFKKINILGVHFYSEANEHRADFSNTNCCSLHHSYYTGIIRRSLIPNQWQFYYLFNIF